MDGRALIERAVTRSRSNFRFAFFFLGARRRVALAAVYRFCRAVDDLVDDESVAPLEAARTLARWRETLSAIEAGRPMPHVELREIARDLEVVVTSHRVPVDALRGIVRGCERDLDARGFATPDELEDYAHDVASCVGYAVLPIMTPTPSHPAAQRFAFHLGRALQLTNILRDVGEDAARGRVYLPESLLSRHGLRPSDVLCGAFDERFEGVATELADRAETHFAAATASAAEFPRRRDLLAAEIMGRTYRGLLHTIRARGFEVYSHRAKLRRRDKLQLAARSVARAAVHQVRAPFSRTGRTARSGITGARA